MIHAEDKKTPLYEAHKSLNAKMVPFCGWLLPLRYTSIIEEHNATREKAGLFDISHLGKIEVKGPGSLEFLQRIFTNDVSNSASQRIVYSPLCNETGGIIDDVFIYNLGKDKYILIVNAVTLEKDLSWLKAKNAEGVDIEDRTQLFGGIAIQGPASLKILSNICDMNLGRLSHREFCEVKVDGFDALLSRSGYTGEDGFEIFISRANVKAAWDDLLNIGRPLGLLPAGLGARDTLRLEAGCPLYGVDVDEGRTPLEARLEKAVDFKKDFIGKGAILERKAKGIKQILVGFKMLDKAVARAGSLIEKAGERIGVVTSGTHSPTLRENIGLGYVGLENSGVGNRVNIIIHGKKRGAEIAKVPFYRRTKRDG